MESNFLKFLLYNAILFFFKIVEFPLSIVLLFIDYIYIYILFWYFKQFFAVQCKLDPCWHASDYHLFYATSGRKKWYSATSKLVLVTVGAGIF